MAKKKKTSYQKKILYILSITFIVVALVAVLELTETVHLFNRQAKSGIIPTKNNSNSTTSSAKKSGTNTAVSAVSTKNPTPALTPNPATTPTSAVLNSPVQVPYGTFVSDHSPNLSGSPHPSSEISSCYTTPGASCTITFTNSSGIVKTLASKVADINGNVSWSWDVNQAGFTTGSWTITATASYGSQNKTTTDQLKLQVGS